MHFEIIGEITDIQTITSGSGIRILPLLRKRYAQGRWRKLKGVVNVRLFDRTIRFAEVHWFEAHGIGKEKCESSVSWTKDYDKASKVKATICYLHRY